MIKKNVMLLLVIFSFSCNGQIACEEGERITNARWYYYSYGMELKSHDRNKTEINPLTLEIKLLRLTQISDDTTDVFFMPFYKDTLNTCSFKPLDLVGVTIVRNKLYLPIYHSIVFDSENDSIVLEKMNKQSLLLQNKIKENKIAISPWLKAEVKRRKIIE